MKLLVLGSGSILSGHARNCAGYVLSAGGKSMVFDFGPGCFQAMKKLESSKAVCDFFFTHYDHPDHVNDFIAFVAARQVGVLLGEEKPRTINVFAPHGFRKFFGQALSIYPFLKKLLFKVRIKEVSNSSFVHAGFFVSSKKVRHTKTSVGFRVSFGKKIFAYGGDCGFDDNIVNLCKGADLALLECSLGNLDEPLVHLNPKACGQIASLSRASVLVLTHVYPSVEKERVVFLAKKEFSGKVIAARDDMELVF